MKRWFYESLINQLKSGDKITVRVVDFYADSDAWMGVDDGVNFLPHDDKLVVQRHQPKPTIWQGKHRITKEDWWAKSNALNTSIIHCQTDWWAFVDDRSVLAPTWLNAIRRAMDGDYSVCGSYEKHAGLVVDNGVVQASKEILGFDTRPPGLRPFDSFYGGSGALPLEWLLAVNGWSEDTCNGAGTEDSMLGVVLRNCGYPIFYDSEMRIIEDRTPSEIDGALKRADKNPHLGRKAKSWSIVRAFHGKTTSGNSFDIRNMRDRVLLNGEDLQSMLPTENHIDWYDSQPVSEME